MSGGTITSLALYRGDTARVHVVDRDGDHGTVRVDLHSKLGVVPIDIGDCLWTQCGHAYWTPRVNIGKPRMRCGIDFDVQLRRIDWPYARTTAEPAARSSESETGAVQDDIEC